MFNIEEKKPSLQMTSKQAKIKIFTFSARSIAESNGVNFKRYFGFNRFKCISVNPNAAELAKILNKTEVGQEPNYISVVENNGVDTNQIRIDFWLKSTSNVDMLIKLSYYLMLGPHYNSTRTKMHVIDEFGRTAWATIDECNKHQIPMYKNGPADISENFTPMYGKDHEFLINFLKSLLWIQPYKYIKNGVVVTNDPEKCKCSLENIQQYFKGDFSELKDLIMRYPENEIWALVGIKKSDDGNLYQVIFKEGIVSVTNKNYRNQIMMKLNDRKAQGAYSNVDFFDGEITEYDVEETDFNKPTEKLEIPTTDENVMDKFFK